MSNDATTTAVPSKLQGKRTYLFLLGLLFPPIASLLGRKLHLDAGVLKSVLDFLSSEDGYQLCTVGFGSLAAWARSRVDKPLLPKKAV